MKEKDKHETGNIYDRIFKENSKSIFLPLVEMILGIEILEYVSLPIKFAKTLEREVDFLFKIEVKNEGSSLLHLEFQTKNDAKMLARMAEYHSLLFRKYQKLINI